MILSSRVACSEVDKAALGVAEETWTGCRNSCEMGAGLSPVKVLVEWRTLRSESPGEKTPGLQATETSCAVCKFGVPIGYDGLRKAAARLDTLLVDGAGERASWSPATGTSCVPGKFGVLIGYAGLRKGVARSDTVRQSTAAGVAIGELGQ